MIWNAADEADERVVQATRWIPIAEHKEILEARAGVYIFADDAFDVKYIGKAGAKRIVVENDKKEKSTEIGFVVEVANAIWRKKDTGATQVKVLYTNSGFAALSLEYDLIKKYNPPNNGKDLIKS